MANKGAKQYWGNKEYEQNQALKGPSQRGDDRLSNPTIGIFKYSHNVPTVLWLADTSHDVNDGQSLGNIHLTIPQN